MPTEVSEEYVKEHCTPLNKTPVEVSPDYVKKHCTPLTWQNYLGDGPVRRRPQLRQSFLGNDQLAFLNDDPERRQELDDVINRFSANPEQSRKRAALAAYFSNGSRDQLGFAYENIHSFIRMYHGREMSIDASFADIASMLSELPETTPAAPQKEPEQPGGLFSYLSGVGGAALWGWARYWNNTGLGLVDTVNLVSGAYGRDEKRHGKAVRDMEFFRNAYLNSIRGELALVPEENQAKRRLLERKLAAVQSIYDARIREEKEAPTLLEIHRQFYSDISQDIDRKLEEARQKYHTGKTLEEQWQEGSWGDLFAESFAVAVDNFALSWIPQSVSYLLGGSALSMGTLVSSSMGDRINQVSELGWSPARVTASALIYGAAEAVPEFFLGKIPIFKRLFGDGAPKGKIARGLWRNAANLGREMLSAGARDTAGELVTFLAEKVQDGVEGVNTPGGKLWWEMSTDEVREFALEGLAETIVGSMGTAGPMGGVAAFREQRTLRAIDAEKHRLLNLAEERRNELAAKEELTPEEQAEAVALDLVLDAANEEAAAQVVKQVDAARQEAAAPENREKIGSPIPEEELSLEEQAEAAANSLELYKTLRHNPLDTVARLREVMRLYRFDNVEIVDRPESFSEAALDAIARHGFSPSMVRGFYDSASDTVYFNAARLSPSEVPGVVFHELVAHKGLREVLAPDAFNSMLDSVSSRHGGEARFREIAERYHLDLETENGRREAAEEYIAHLAEERNEALKPSWWREFLAQVKQLLRRLPYLDRVRWSDREIEALLRRSARAMRRRNRAGSNRDAGMFFAVNENGETLFHVTGRDNAMTAQEIIDDPTISPDDFVLTSEGSEIWGEITPEMVEKAGGKSGIKALPIKLQKGRHRGPHSGFGLAHLYTEHGKELEGKHYDLSALLTRIFGKPYQVYVSSGRGNIRLEMVTRNRPREIGVLELQEENGFYSVITAYQLSWARSKVRGELVWQYSVPQVPSDKQQAGPLNPLSADKVASTARLSRTKPDSNINDSQEKSSLSDVDEGESENPVRFSVAPPDENLVVVHNLSAQKLRRAAKLGGMPVPSLAIIDAEKSDFTNYGEISLIADKELIDPKFRSNRVFNADIYSARAPRSRKFYSDIDYENAEKVLSRFDGGDEEDQRLNTVMKRFRSGMYDSDAELEDILMRKTYAALNWYCKEHGIKTPEDWQEQDKIKYSKDFRNWWETYAIPEMGLNPEEKMFAGTTSSGRSKWIPLSLENVVKAMTKKVRNGEGFFYGVGNIRSMKAKQFKSISQIQKQRDNIVSPETMKTLKDEIEQELKTLSSKMEQANDRSKFGWEFNTAEDCLMAMAEGGYENLKYLHDRFGDNQELFQEMADFLDKLINMPTEYFEAKLQRAVGFDEFRAAVIPDDTPADVRKILEDAGLQIYTYSDESGRKAALQLATIENPDIRFSASGQAEELANLMAKRVAPIIRDANGRDSDVREEVRTLLSQEGFDLSDAELEEIIKRAQQQVRRFRSLQRLTEENDYIRATDPWIATLQDVYSTNFKISTAGKYATEDFSGTWIGKDGGVAPDEAARTLSAAFGQEITDDDVVDHFRYLKRRDLLAKRREENKAMEEALREEERLHDMELAEQILAGEFPFDDEFIGSNPRVAKMVRDMVSPAKPGEPRADWATVRAALGQENPQEFAKGYFEGREAGRQEYRERLREARKNTTDIRTLQEIATREVRRVLPEELQGAFLKRIAELGKFRTEPSPAYPQGRRAYELDKLIRDINSYEIRSRIIALADRYTAKRNYKGIPVSILENMQRELDEIRTVLRLSPAAVALKIAENSAAIEALEQTGASADNIEELKTADVSIDRIKQLYHENMVLSTFGNLGGKSPQELDQAMGALELVISTGKLRFAEKLDKRQELIGDMRLRAFDEAGNQGEKARTLPDGMVTKQTGLRTLLDWVSLKSGKKFEDTFSGELMRRVEDATEEEKTRLRKMQKSFARLLEQIGVKTLREKMEFFRELGRKEEKTGVHRLVYISKRAFRKDAKSLRTVRRRPSIRRPITVELARKFLADHDSGEAPMAHYTAEFLRLQLAAIDAGVKKEIKIKGMDAEEGASVRLAQDMESEERVLLIEPVSPEEEQSIDVEIPLTRDAAMQIWLHWQQPDVRAGMEWNGWSAESIRQLEKFLGERYLTLAKGLRSLIAEGRQELNARVEEFYGAGLPENPNYFPAKHLESLGTEIKSDVLLGSEYGQMSISPGFLIARKFHLLDVDSDGTAIGSFFSNQMQAAYFLAFGRVIRDARAVYNDRDVRERIIAEYGRDVFEQLIDRINMLARGGRQTPDGGQILTRLYKVWVPAQIAINDASVAKQIAGVVNYMNDIPAGAFFRGFADANIKSELFRRFIADSKVQEYLANRMEGGFDRDLSYLLNSNRNIENYNPLASAIIEYGTMPTRLADKWCTVRGGFAVFQYHYNEVLKRTGNEREAWDTAVRMWRRSTDETQQSGSLKDQNLYQSMGGWARYLTVFMSAPIQMMNREFIAVNRMLAGTGERRAEARRELARVVLINHLVCPFLMEALTQFFRAGFEWDEYEFGSFLTGFLLGPFEGFLFFGKLARALGDRLTRSGGWQQTFQALPMADTALNAVSTLLDIAEFDDFDSDDWMKTIKAAGDITMAAGSMHPAGGLAAAVGGAVSSTVRELRRIFRIVESAE